MNKENIIKRFKSLLPEWVRDNPDNISPLTEAAMQAGYDEGYEDGRKIEYEKGRGMHDCPSCKCKKWEIDCCKPQTDSLEKHITEGRCIGIAVSGELCHRYAIQGSKWCDTHGKYK